MDTVIAKYHLHPIIDHFTIALLATGIITDVGGYIIMLLFRGKSPTIQSLAERLRGAALILLVPGALSAILSRLSGESEAERVWESISPAAQQILLSDSGSARLLSHAVLGTYLMYVFIVLAGWRTLLETWTRFKQTQLLYFGASMIALCALLYQGKREVNSSTIMVLGPLTRRLHRNNRLQETEWRRIDSLLRASWSEAAPECDSIPRQCRRIQPMPSFLRTKLSRDLQNSVVTVMRIVPLTPDSERCDECRRRANYRINFRNISNVLLCHRCAVRLIVGLVGRIASTEVKGSPAAAKHMSSRQT